ncbi:MAG: DUF1905 domain-containing protein [Cytophagaceae bacterium]|jgi:hypothetical protein|nr:DUF1905 domain-containing protein [Cytophagaceae bacterium]
MEYLVENEKLELKYQPGKGAWTYNIQIPNTKDIVGKWGTIKVSGFIDDYKIESKNLLSIKGQDKLISINGDIRKSINKDAGDFVIVTLYLLTPQTKITENDILETLQDANVLSVFNGLESDEKKEIISKITAQKIEETQTNMLIQLINRLSKKG